MFLQQTTINKYQDFYKRFQEVTEKHLLQQEFEDLFFQILNEIDDANDIEFLGNSSYSGVNFSLKPDHCYMGVTMNIELQLTNDTLTIYDGNHNGFWVPPFAIINSSCCASRHKEIREAFVNKMRSLMLLG